MNFKIGDLEILDHIWYGDLGFVKALDTITGEIKFYIGAHLGYTIKEDIRYIVQMGTKYTIESFKNLLNWIENK